MISPAEIQYWRNRVPWNDDDQVEQDLILARLMIEIANDALLGDELIMRGGTCFHMLWLDRPWRYSEDLDYVRRSAGPVGPVLDALRSIGEWVGFDKTSTAVGRHPKANMHSTFASGNRLRVKVEMNTFERSPALPTTSRTLTVDSPWFAGSADVPTFEVEELTATPALALANLEAKLADHTFTTDIDRLLIDRPDGYDAASAAETVRAIINAIRETP